MRIYCSQNLFGVLVIDNWRVTDFYRHGVLSNGIALDGNGGLLLGDWSRILRLDSAGRHVSDMVVQGYDNLHTVNLWRGEVLAASTGNDRVFLGSECIFIPKEHGWKDFTYVNSAYPYHDDIILISLRHKHAVVFYDTGKRKVEKVLVLPFLHNQHHPVPFMEDLFLVSDGDGIVMFNEEGKFMQKSPPLNWPRGIKVLGRTKVLAVDRRGIVEYNPAVNRFMRRLDTPVPPPTEMVRGDERVTGGALFDLVFVDE